MGDIFLDIGIIIITATLFAYVLKILKQPRILGYVLAGIVIGPLGFRWITDIDVIRTLSEIGIAFMLFVVGMELDFRKIKDTGFIATLGGTIKSIILFLAGFLIAIYFGFIELEAAYIGLILAFSSTMIVVKALSDKKELDTLHGRIIIGILLIEDIFAILVLSTLITLNNFNFIILVTNLLQGIGLILLAYLLGKYVFPFVFKFAARSSELLFLLAVSTAFSFSLLANYFSFSIAIGSFVAGMALANLPYNLEIVSRVKPLRDFFATLFFVTLGMELIINSFNLRLLLILLALIIIFKPFLIMVLTSLFGYKKRTSFLTSLSLSQISEFSLIIVAQGMILGHISQNIFSITVILAVATMTISSYFIKFDTQIYYLLSKPLSFLDKLSSGKREIKPVIKRTKYDVILIGMGRIGYAIDKTLKKLKKKFIVIDYNPEIIKELSKKDIPCIYGDIADSEVLKSLNFKKAEMVISTIPTKKDNLLLTKKAKAANKNITVFVTAYTIDTALELYNNGADYVILPHFLGGDHFSILLNHVSKDINKLLKYKISHIKELKKKKKY